MVKRLISVTVLILAWLSGGVFLDACQRIELRVPDAERNAPLSVRQSPSSQAVWLWGSLRPTAVDAQTGAMLHRTYETLGEFASTRDKQRQYVVTWERRIKEFKLYLTWLDMAGAVEAPRYLLATYPAKRSDLYENALATIILSKDEKSAFITLTENYYGSWRTSILSVDVAFGTVSEPGLIFDSPVDWGPNVNLALTTDERLILVTRSVGKRDHKGRVYVTSIAIVDRGTLRVTRTLVIPEEIRADSVWGDIRVDPGGESFYVIESIWRDAGAYELRFSSFALATGAFQLSHLNRRTTIETGCDARFHFFRDTNVLWNWCGQFIQFLDPRTGQIAEMMDVVPKLSGASFADYVLSSDGTTLYTVFPTERRVVVVDLATRKIIRQVQLREQAFAPDPHSPFERWFFKSAEAKFSVRPIMALSPDETWLAFAYARDFETIDGVWVVETATLKPIGHWLSNQNISSVRAGPDGRSLYVLNRLRNKLQTIEAGTGQESFAVDFPVAENSGFVADAQP